ncbi:MAG: lysophospholipid acyltransferase family protein [Bdellovibrio sp.]
MQSLIAAKKTLSICTRTYGYLRRSRQGGADLAQLKQLWAEEMLERVGLQVQITGLVSEKPGLLFVGNHLSYLDIPLLMAAAPRISFVAKKEIGDWPLFGDGARAMDTIFVHRESSQHRKAARGAVAEGLLQGKRIAVFPSGTTSLDEAKPWRRGVFEIAKQEACWIQPFRIRYEPSRLVAFIGQDALLPHLSALMKTQGLKAHIEFHAPVLVQDAEQSAVAWQSWAQAGLREGRQMLSELP